VTILYHAHSGLRYLVLLAAVAALLGLAYALATGRAGRPARVLSAAFTGLLDLQLVLGIGLVIGGIFNDAVAGHMVLMVLAVAAAHGSSMIGQRAHDDRRELGIRLGGVAIAVALIVGGILVLGRSIVGSAPPTVS
jgi:hypothetical protein